LPDLHFNGLSEPIITDIKRDQSKHSCKIAHQAQEITILSLLHAMMKNILLNNGFDMGRAAFQAKKDASAIHDLILWSEKLQD
jgi:DNA polymerase-3 subunit delta'